MSSNEQSRDNSASIVGNYLSEINKTCEAFIIPRDLRSGMLDLSSPVAFQSLGTIEGAVSSSRLKPNDRRTNVRQLQYLVSQVQELIGFLTDHPDLNPKVLELYKKVETGLLRIQSDIPPFTEGAPADDFVDFRQHRGEDEADTNKELNSFIPKLKSVRTQKY